LPEHLVNRLDKTYFSVNQVQRNLIQSKAYSFELGIEKIQNLSLAGFSSRLFSKNFPNVRLLILITNF
jgi:hypothetical protein